MMTNDQEELLRIVDSAINSFNEKEYYLIKNDLSERCICSKFAQYLNISLKNMGFKYDSFDVDVEYNRGFDGKDNKPKKIYNKPATVDLIVHKRGSDKFYGFDNLICIEMKKTNDTRGETGIESDKERLRVLTDYSFGYNYQLGILLIVDIKNMILKYENLFLLR